MFKGKVKKHEVNQEIKELKQPPLEMMNKGKRYLKNKTYELKEFSRLKKNVEKKKLQL